MIQVVQELINKNSCLITGNNKGEQVEINLVISTFMVMNELRKSVLKKKKEVMLNENEREIEN